MRNFLTHGSQLLISASRLTVETKCSTNSLKSKTTGQPLHRSARESAASRRVKKLTGKSTWFKDKPRNEDNNSFSSQNLSNLMEESSRNIIISGDAPPRVETTEVHTTNDTHPEVEISANMPINKSEKKYQTPTSSSIRIPGSSTKKVDGVSSTNARL